MSLEHFQLLSNHLSQHLCKRSCSGTVGVAHCTLLPPVRLPGEGNSNSHGAWLFHPIITTTEWIQTGRLPIKNFLSLYPSARTTHIRSLHAAAERGGNTLNGCEDLCAEYSSSQGQNRALIGLLVPSLLDTADWPDSLLSRSQAFFYKFMLVMRCICRLL